MTQDEILSIIKNEPGIDSADLRKKYNIPAAMICYTVAALVRKKLVRREPGKTRRTYTMFAV